MTGGGDKQSIKITPAKIFAKSIFQFSHFLVGAKPRLFGLGTGEPGSEMGLPAAARRRSSGLGDDVINRGSSMCEGVRVRASNPWPEAAGDVIS